MRTNILNVLTTLGLFLATVGPVNAGSSVTLDQPGAYALILPSNNVTTNFNFIPSNDSPQNEPIIHLARNNLQNSCVDDCHHNRRSPDGRGFGWVKCLSNAKENMNRYFHLNGRHDQRVVDKAEQRRKESEDSCNTLVKICVQWCDSEYQ